MPRALPVSSMQLGQVHVLVDVTLAGRVHRLSRGVLEVYDKAGTRLRYEGGLNSADVTSALAAIGSVADSLVVPVTCVLPVDVAQLEAMGHRLAGAKAEVRLWAQGQVWDDAYLVVAGEVSEPTYGRKGEAVAFSVSVTPWDDAGTIIQPGAVFASALFADDPILVAAVAAATYEWATDADGEPLPFVFGKLGAYETGAGLKLAPGAPALPLAVEVSSGKTRYFVLAGHHIEASEITLWDSAGNSDTVSIDVATGPYDGSLRVSPTGIAYTRIFIGGTSAVDLESGPWYWSPSITSPASGGIAYDHGRPATTAGEVIDLLLRRCSSRIDWGRWAALRPLLDRYEVAGVVDDPEAAPLDFIRDNFLPLLPLALVRGPRGITPIVWRYDARDIDAVAHLVIGPGQELALDGDVETSPPSAELINELSLSFAPDEATGAYRRTITHTPNWRDGNGVDTTGSSHATAAAAAAGTVRTSSQSTDVVYQAQTAARSLDELVRRQCVAHRKLPVRAGWRWSWLTGGDVVLVTCAELSIARLRALIVEPRVTPDGLVLLRLHVLNDPTGSRHAAA